MAASIPAAAVSVITGCGAECGERLVAMRTSTVWPSPVHPHRRGGGRGVHESTCVAASWNWAAKSAMLVLRDVDPASAAGIAAQGIFTHGGQICMANSRIVVERPLAAPFIAALRRRRKQFSWEIYAMNAAATVP